MQKLSFSEMLMAIVILILTFWGFCLIPGFFLNIFAKTRRPKLCGVFAASSFMRQKYPPLLIFTSKELFEKLQDIVRYALGTTGSIQVLTNDPVVKSQGFKVHENDMYSLAHLLPLGLSHKKTYHRAVAMFHFLTIICEQDFFRNVR